MARLPRPYIPIEVRLQVIERQITEAGKATIVFDSQTKKQQLDALIRFMFGDAKVELHHRPALCNRPRNAAGTDYNPPANSAEHLVYLREDDHDIETRVRGLGALRSDLSQARYLKKVARNRSPNPKCSSPIRSRGFAKGKRPFPKKKFQRRH